MRPVDEYELDLHRWAGALIGRTSVWGESDCIMLGLQAVDIVRGTSAAADWAGRWHDEDSAVEQVIAHLPGDYLREIGAEPLPPAYASTGDIFLLPWAAAGNVHAACYVCLGSRSLAATPGGQIELIPTRAVRMQDGAQAWSVVRCPR